MAISALTRAMNASRFKGESGQSLTVMAPSGVRASRVILIGLGEAEKVNDLAAQTFGRAWKAVAGTGDKSALIAVDPSRARSLKPGRFPPTRPSALCLAPTGSTSTAPGKRPIQNPA